MRPLKDYYIVELEQLYEKGMSIFIPGQNLGVLEKIYEGEDMEALYNPDRYRRTFAKITGVPFGMSSKNIEMVDVGSPAPKSYIDHDTIIKNKNLPLVYNPSTYIPKNLTFNDKYDVLFLEGETLHFFWTATKDPENQLSIDRMYGQTDNVGNLKMKYTFKISVIEAICSTNDAGLIKMNNGMCLVEKIMQNEDDIKTSSGLYFQSEVKAEKEVGIIRHSDKLPVGDKIKFVPNADYEIEVAGKKYYAMKESDIYAVINNSNLTPVDNQVIIKKDMAEDRTKSGILINKIQYPRGTVISIGPNCKEVQQNDKIIFGLSCGSETEHQGETYLILKETDIMCVV